MWAGPGRLTRWLRYFYHMTYGHMIIVPQPPSQSSKDVGRFNVAASRPQVIITGQQGTLNNPRIFCKEKGT